MRSRPGAGRARQVIAVLPGDFVGPEVVDAALEALEALKGPFGLDLEVHRWPFGGGSPSPELDDPCIASEARKTATAPRTPAARAVSSSRRAIGRGPGWEGDCGSG